MLAVLFGIKCKKECSRSQIMSKKVLALSARTYLIGAIDEDSRCGFPFSRLLEGRSSCRREDFFSHFSDQLFDETTLSTVQHKCTRENPRTVKFPAKFWTKSSLVFIVFTFFRPPPDQENTLRHCFCCRRAARSTPEKYVLVKRLIMPTGNSITIATGHPNCVTKQHMINKTSFTQYHCPVI